MITSLKFFFAHLKWYQISIFGMFLSMHISSYVWHLNADKHLTKRIPKILANQNDYAFSVELFNILLINIGYLILYAITMFIIETIGKLAVKNAINRTSEKMLKVDLSKISKKQYEHDIVSIVHHGENVTSAIRNLFIEFPRKIVACHHFLVALRELSFEIMIYCTIVNIIFVLMTITISHVRKFLLSKVVDSNINFSVVCADLSNSIQTYKIDNRLEEYQNKINKLTSDIWYCSSFDSLMIASNESVTSFSGQFMVGLISYMCRPMVINKTISVEDLMYGVRSSSKFIEKMIGILEYFGDVIRQYKSFNFFLIAKNKIETEITSTKKDIKSLNILKEDLEYRYNVGKYNGRLVHIAGPNGVGKTTILLKFLGVSYKDATSKGSIIPYDINKHVLMPTSYRNKIAFVQQNIPSTHDNIKEYVAAVTKSNKNISKLLNETFDYFGIESNSKKQILNFISTLDVNKCIRELSGGQAKFLQIITAVTKLYTLKGNILVLDEPSNNLDIDKVKYVKEIIDACTKKNIMVFMVTHDNRMVNGKDTETIDLS
ncbi:ABC transporter [Tupanvirus deep ocean]|uniref:ABC transporter n=2 Tax=Tupanvirus TaxID=2094720 RepID=A0AC62A7T7_9VIRU|nr:ABC transporter [Tupanvirus deep ocean]QKU33841.1 ABC transporter [Tupanvirus deep ocean]